MKTPEKMAEEFAEKVHSSLVRIAAVFLVNERIFNYENMKDTFLAGYKAAAPQWISVKDRLPENISDVLILSKEKESCVGYYRSSDNDWNMYNPCCSFHMELHGVTHWMPLPEPPKEEE